jgi:hypothetical protein
MERRQDESVGSSMSVNGRIQHDPNCKEPLNEHSGSEPCLRWVEDEIPLRGGPMQFQGFWKRGPQGNMIYDFAGEFRARFGKAPDGPLGTPEVEDRRDNRDPAALGTSVLTARAAERAERNGSES